MACKEKHGAVIQSAEDFGCVVEDVPFLFVRGNSIPIGVKTSCGDKVRDAVGTIAVINIPQPRRLGSCIIGGARDARVSKEKWSRVSNIGGVNRRRGKAE